GSGGSLTKLHAFNGTDGETPESGLVQASDGNFYGTTFFGGTSCSGTVFKITPAGTLTRLHCFGGLGSGENPVGALVQATDGNFYGTTKNGGNQNCVSGCGTVYQITPEGVLTTIHSFDRTDGGFPQAGMVQGTD